MAAALEDGEIEELQTTPRHTNGDYGGCARYGGGGRFGGGHRNGVGYSGLSHTPDRDRGRSRSRDGRDVHYGNRGLGVVGRGRSANLQHHRGRPQQHQQDEIGRLLRTLKDITVHRREKVAYALRLVNLGALIEPRRATIIITTLGRCRAVEHALEIFAKVPSPDAITYNAAISACEKAADPKRAVELLREMHKNGLKPDVITYNAAISACEKAADPNRAIKLLR